MTPEVDTCDQSAVGFQPGKDWPSARDIWRERDDWTYFFAVKQQGVFDGQLDGGVEPEPADVFASIVVIIGFQRVAGHCAASAGVEDNSD